MSKKFVKKFIVFQLLDYLCFHRANNLARFMLI